jgi:hypothetical protein
MDKNIFHRSIEYSIGPAYEMNNTLISAVKFLKNISFFAEDGRFIETMCFEHPEIVFTKRK